MPHRILSDYYVTRSAMVIACSIYQFYLGYVGSKVMNHFGWWAVKAMYIASVVLCTVAEVYALASL